jgi:hypothetical protein
VNKASKLIAVLAAAWMLGMLAPAGGVMTSFASISIPVADAAAADDKMAQITLIIKKLRESMASLKDLDALEKAGMPKKDVDRMRRALKEKNQQMINEAIAEIQSL